MINVGKNVSKQVSELKADTTQRGVNICSAPYNADPTGVSDSTSAIQAAIDFVTGLGGGSVIIPRGTFIFTKLTIKDNVHLVGTGGTLKLKDNVCVNASLGYYLLTTWKGAYDNYNNVVLDSLIIDGNFANNTLFLVADAITIGGENAVIKNCTIINPPDSGIMFSHAKNSLCINNRISGASDLGIYVNDGDGTTHYENVISGNRISDCRFGGIGMKRITQRTIVSDNTIYNCGNGITLEDASTGVDFSKNMTIIGNRMRYIGYIEPTAAKRGINIRCSDFTNVIGNTIEDCYGNGILVEGSANCNIESNIIMNAVGASLTDNIGILCTDKNGLGCNKNNISNNIIDSAQYRGIYLSGSLTSQYNRVSGNKVTNTVGVAFRNSSNWANNEVSGNVFGGSTDLSYGGGTDNLVTNNTLVNGNVSTGLDATNRVAIEKRANSISSVVNITSIGTVSPTTLTWNQGDRVINASPTVGQPKAWVCTVSGTQGTLNGGATTGSITSGTKTLTVNSSTGLSVGHFITIAGVSGVKKITAISGTTITVDFNADATVTGVAVAYRNATFVSEGNL